MRLCRTITVALAAITLLSGCAGASTAGSSGGKLTVVTTTTVFADMVSNVGGDLVSVTSIVPKNADVHTFEPRPDGRPYRWPARSCWS